MKKSFFLGLLAMVMTLTGCINENWSDVLLSVRVSTDGATFVDDRSDIEYVENVYVKALTATGKVEAMGSGNYVIRRQHSAAEVTAIAQEAMDKANAELKDYKSKNRSMLQVAYVYKFAAEPDMEIKSPNYGTSYTEADVEKVEAVYLMQMELITEDVAALETFKSQVKSYAVCYYDIANDKYETKSLNLDEVFDLRVAGQSPKKAGFYWYLEPKEEGVLPTVGVSMRLTQKEMLEVAFKDGRKSLVTIGVNQFDKKGFNFKDTHMAQLCSATNRTVVQGAILPIVWDQEMQDYNYVYDGKE